VTALSADRNTPRREGGTYLRPVKGGVKIFIGALVVLDAAGYAKPGVTALSLKADGRAEAFVDNSAGADGAVNVPVRAGNYYYANSASTDTIAQADVGNTAYIVDDQTVAKTDGGGTRSAAGKIIDVDATGVWVAVGTLHL